MKHSLISIITTLILLFIINEARPQTNTSHKTFYLGAAIGGGSNFISVSETTHSFARFSAPNLKIGYRFNGQWLGMFYLPGGTHIYAKSERAFEALTLAGQYYPTTKLWVNAGMGLALEATPFYLVDYNEGFPVFNTGFAGTASIGYEIIRISPRFNMEIQARWLYGNLNSSIGQKHSAFDILLGINYN